MLKMYLCGPIAGCNDAEAHDWRDWVKEVTHNWAICLDPMRRDYRGAGHADKDDRMPDWVVKEIVELDKVDIAQSDVVLANLLPEKKMVGSNMEIIHAWGIGKLVVLVHDLSKPISPWHRYHSHKIVPALSDALVYIKDGHWRA